MYERNQLQKSDYHTDETGSNLQLRIVDMCQNLNIGQKPEKKSRHLDVAKNEQMCTLIQLQGTHSRKKCR
jgi:hypothetical protein